VPIPKRSEDPASEHPTPDRRSSLKALDTNPPSQNMPFADLGAQCSSLNPPPTAADKALGQALDEGNTTMLAEIFLLRMEAIDRASKESAPAGNSRFIPITLPRSRGFCSWVDGVDFQLMLRK
jgi:hypothetical protein